VQGVVSRLARLCVLSWLGWLARGWLTATENGAKGIFTGGQAHRLYQGSVQNGPQYRRGCVSRL